MPQELRDRHVMRVGGIVLCGGRSSRMGAPKAWLPFGGELMLPRIVRLLREAVDPVVVVAARDQDVPLLPHDVRVVRDREDGRGPLAGLAAGLDALSGMADVAYLSSCDVPLLTSAFVKRVVESLGDAAIAVPRIDGVPQPLAAAYRLELAPAVERLLASGRSRLIDLLEGERVRYLDAGELPGIESLRNVNTKDEYEAALRMWSGHSVTGLSAQSGHGVTGPH